MKPTNSHPVFLLVLAGVAALACSLGAVRVAAAEGDEALTAVIPPLEAGVEPGAGLSGAAWEEAVKLSNFAAVGSRRLEQRGGAAYLGHTPERLWIGVASEMPPDGELARGASEGRRDFTDADGDSVEIWIDPTPGEADEAARRRPYFRLIVNARGDVSDAKLDPGHPRADAAWDAGATVVSRPGDQRRPWEVVVGVPWESLGVEAPAASREIGLLIARNFKRPLVRATTTPFRGSFARVAAYPRFTLGAAGDPYASVASLGDEILEGKPEVEVELTNPGDAAQRFTLEGRIESSDTPTRTFDRTIEVPAGETRAAAWRITGTGTLNADAEHDMTLTVSAGERTVLHNRYHWTKPERPAWVVDDQRPAVLQAAYYPTLKKVKVKIDPLGLEQGGAPVGTSVTVTVTDPEAEAEAEEAPSAEPELTPPGEPTGIADLMGLSDEEPAEASGPEVDAIRRATFELAHPLDPTEHVIDLPALADGEYSVTARIDTTPPHTAKTTITRKRFAFEGNRLGIPRRVYPPFTPMKASDDATSVVLRDMAVGEMGLWSSIVAADEELLAAPIRLVANGEAVTGWARLFDHDELHATHKAGAHVAGARVTVEAVTEFDGCQRVELTLDPSRDNKTLDSLVLEVPLKPEAAAMWHPNVTKPRVNPAGRTPGGEGRFWDSSMFYDKKFHGYFLPYMWLGMADRGRGLAWFAANDRGWEIETNADGERVGACLSLSRERVGGAAAVVLRVHLVQTPVRLDEPRTITFGLMPTPAKPMPDDWRRWRFDRQRHFDQATYPSIVWMGAQYWGSDSDYHNRYPRNGDLTILNEIQNARVTKHLNTEFLDLWNRRNTHDAMPKRVRGMYRGLNRVCVQRAVETDHRSAMNVYWENSWTTSATHPEARAFKQEWRGGYNDRTYDVDNLYKTRVKTIRTGRMFESYVDFAVYWGAEFVRRGIGLYFDNTYIAIDNDTLSSDAYRLPDGSIQRAANIWRKRAYFKRIWTIHQQLDPDETPAIMMLHMTNTHVAPMMSFNESNLDLEYYRTNKPVQTRFPWDMLLVQSTGLKTGNIPLGLGDIDHESDDEEAKAAARRSRFGVMMVHEIKVRYLSAERPGGKPFQIVHDFGYGLDDCRVYNYWAPGFPLEIGDENLKALVLHRDGETLIVFCTWNDRARTHEIDVDPELLADGPARAVDAETGENLADDAASFTLDMPAYGTRLIRITPK